MFEGNRRRYHPINKYKRGNHGYIRKSHTFQQSHVRTMRIINHLIEQKGIYDCYRNDT